MSRRFQFSLSRLFSMTACMAVAALAAAQLSQFGREEVPEGSIAAVIAWEGVFLASGAGALLFLFMRLGK